MNNDIFEIGYNMKLLERDSTDEIQRLQKQLDIAVKAIKKGINLAYPYFPYKTFKQDAFYCLKKIQKELGIALQQIKELESDV